MRLLLIRHGQTPANVRGELDTGHPGPGLTRLGQAQAAAIPLALSSETIDAVFASTLVRTQLTAQPLADSLGLDVRVLPGIHEIEAGDLEMATDHASYRAYLGTAYAWGMGDRDPVMPGGTDGHAFFDRFDTSMAQVLSSGATTAVVVSHGAAIRVWVAGVAGNMRTQDAAELELDNTALVVLDHDAATGWQLASWMGEPVGGHLLADDAAEDPTGEPLDEAVG